MLRMIPFMFLVISSLLVASDSPPHMHVLLVGDTVSKGREHRACARSDLFLMKEALKSIARQIGSELKLTILKDELYNRRQARKWLKSLPNSGKDIVVFFYTGHGFKDEGKTAWPILSFTNNAPLRGTSIVEFFRKHHQRLSLAIFNACNAGRRDLSPSWSPVNPIISSNNKLSGLGSLFLMARGNIVITACSRGQTASADPSGSPFVISLLEAMLKTCVHDTSWSVVLENTKTLTRAHTSYNHYENPQEPFYTID